MRVCLSERVHEPERARARVHVSALHWPGGGVALLGGGGGVSPGTAEEAPVSPGTLRLWGSSGSKWESLAGPRGEGG